MEQVSQGQHVNPIGKIYLSHILYNLPLFISDIQQNYKTMQMQISSKQ